MKPTAGLLAATALSIALYSSACGPAEEASLTVRIHYTQPETLDTLRANPQPPGEPPPNITDFRLCVSAADMNKPRCQNFNLNDYQKRKKARIDDLPAGSDRRVTFQGYFYQTDVSAIQVFWCGEARGVEIKKNRTTRVNMFITSCSDFTLARNQMKTPRVFHSATRIPDGRVALIGGFHAASARDDQCPGGPCVYLTATNTVDLYDPATGTFDSESGMILDSPRALHSATLLPDGRILVAGGCQRALWQVEFPQGPRPVISVDPDGWGTAGSTAEIVDVVAGSVQPAETAMPISRAAHAEMLLPDGDVLLLGGMGPVNNQPLQSATRYLVHSGEFEEIAAALAVARQGMLLVPLDGARALIWGGNHPPAAGPGDFAEILEVDSEGQLRTQPPAFVDSQPGKGLPSFYSAGVRLGSEEVLVTGGMLVKAVSPEDTDPPYILLKYRRLGLQTGAESIVEPINEANCMPYLYAFHTASMLFNNKVLIAGGVTISSSRDWFCDPQDKAVFYHPGKKEGENFAVEQIGGISVILNQPRAGHSATELWNQTVLFAGGISGRGELVLSNTAEIYNPAPRELRFE